MADPSFLPAFIWLLFAGIVALVLLITSFMVKPSGGKKKKERADGNADDRVAERRQRRGADRMRRGMQADDDDDDEGDQDGDEFGERPPWDDAEKIGTKKRRKLEMKAEKKAMREEMENEREERKLRQKMMEGEAKRAEKIRKKHEEKEEEEKQKIKEEQERLEHEEYLRIKESFSVENEGSGELELQEESQSLLQEFIDYIKTTKVVLLEDLAAHFGLRTQEAINRVHVLQEVGRLTGVVDDRGKFIYISQEELEAVAKFIKQRGRVSITELSDSSNNLINLEVAFQRKEVNVQPVEASA